MGAAVYVVRIIIPGNDTPDFKVFEKLGDARERFNLADNFVPDELTSVALFEVPDEKNARQAVDAVKEGRAVLLDRDRHHERDRKLKAFLEEAIRNGSFKLDIEPGKS